MLNKWQKPSSNMPWRNSRAIMSRSWSFDSRILKRASSPHRLLEEGGDMGMRRREMRTDFLLGSEPTSQPFLGQTSSNRIEYEVYAQAKSNPNSKQLYHYYRGYNSPTSPFFFFLLFSLSITRASLIRFSFFCFRPMCCLFVIRFLIFTCMHALFSLFTCRVLPQSCVDSSTL